MWRCTNCGEEHDDNFEACWNCGSNKEGQQNDSFTPISNNEEYEFQSIELPDLIYTTTSDIKTHVIKRYIGVVSGETILGANIISDVISGITDIVGGRSGVYESYLKEAKKIALKECAEQAQQIGATAVIGIDFDYETIRGTMLMVSCTGTAVIAEEISDGPPPHIA